MKNVGFQYAGVAVFLMIIVFLVSYYIGVHPFIEMSHLFFDLFVYGLVIFFALNEYKKVVNEGILHFWEGMTIGFFVGIFSCGIYVVFLFLMMNFDENILISYQQEAIDFLEIKSVQYIESFGKEQYQNQLETIQETTILDLILLGGLKKFISAMLITPVFSILKRKT
jgi:hypothetical protein